MIPRSTAIVLVTSGLALLPMIRRAQARIACSNGFQNVQGSWLATPYCQDELVAVVARQYGMKASAEAIRENPNFKREVCRLIGQDIRVKETCNEVNPTARGRF
jgi:hypothetical protein